MARGDGEETLPSRPCMCSRLPYLSVGAAKHKVVEMLKRGVCAITKSANFERGIALCQLNHALNRCLAGPKPLVCESPRGTGPKILLHGDHARKSCARRSSISCRALLPFTYRILVFITFCLPFCCLPKSLLAPDLFLIFKGKSRKGRHSGKVGGPKPDPRYSTW